MACRNLASNTASRILSPIVSVVFYRVYPLVTGGSLDSSVSKSFIHSPIEHNGCRRPSVHRPGPQESTAREVELTSVLQRLHGLQEDGQRCQQLLPRDYILYSCCTALCYAPSPAAPRRFSDVRARLLTREMPLSMFEKCSLYATNGPKIPTLSRVLLKAMTASHCEKDTR